MVVNKKDFYGKNIADAIQAACLGLDEPQERLDIEVVETGSSGILGLIRKKAHIRVSVKERIDDDLEGRVDSSRDRKKKRTPPSERKKGPRKKEPEQKVVEAGEDLGETVEQVSEENLELIRTELNQLLTLMGFPSSIELSAEGLSVHCRIESEFEDALTGPDGKTLDSLQYLLRKMVARKIPDRLRLALDVGDFRQRRLEELKERARELGEQVKIDGKTQVISALNPSERRVVHIVLQNEKGVRSRSVGDGLFKKVLIYKPGKGRRSGAKRRQSSRSGKEKSGKAKRSNNN